MSPNAFRRAIASRAFLRMTGTTTTKTPPVAG